MDLSRYVGGPEWGDRQECLSYEERPLAEASEVEVDRDGVPFGGSDLDDGGIGSKGIGEKLELDGGARERATAVFGTEVIGLPGRSKGSEFAIFAENLDVKIYPKVRRTLDEAGGRAGTRACWARNQSSIGFCEVNLDNDFDGFRLAAVIERGLLRAVARAVLTGELSG